MLSMRSRSPPAHESLPSDCPIQKRKPGDGTAFSAVAPVGRPGCFAWIEHATNIWLQVRYFQEKSLEIPDVSPNCLLPRMVRGAGRPRGGPARRAPDMV